MENKTDEEIIKEVGLETSNNANLEESNDELLIQDDNELNMEEEPPHEKIDNNKENSEQENISEKENEEVIPIQKKQPKIYKILISVVAFLSLTLTIGAILYFMGYFDPEPSPEIEKKVTKTKEIKKDINFNVKELNKKRLNKKLKMLTKYEIMNKDELNKEENKIILAKKKKKEKENKEIALKKKKDEEKIIANYAKIEKEKKYLQKQQNELKKEYENFKKMQEKAKIDFEMKKNNLLQELENKTIITPTEQTIANINEEDEPQIIEKDVIENKEIKYFLSFINVATIKGNLHKEFLDKVQKFDKKLSLCRDSKNRIEILFGPYDSNKERNKIFNNLLENNIKEAYLIDFTLVEYQKRCKY